MSETLDEEKYPKTTASAQQLARLLVPSVRIQALLSKVATMKAEIERFVDFRKELIEMRDVCEVLIELVDIAVAQQALGQDIANKSET